MPLRAVVGGNVKTPERAPSRRTNRVALVFCALTVLFVVVLPVAAQPPPLTAPPTDQPLILDDRVIDRPPQDFAGLPSVISDDPFLSPLLWPVDPPLGYAGPSGI